MSALEETGHSETMQRQSDWSCLCVHPENSADKWTICNTVHQHMFLCSSVLCHTRRGNLR